MRKLYYQMFPLKYIKKLELRILNVSIDAGRVSDTSRKGKR